MLCLWLAANEGKGSASAILTCLTSGSVLCSGELPAHTKSLAGMIIFVTGVTAFQVWVVLLYTTVYTKQGSE